MAPITRNSKRKPSLTYLHKLICADLRTISYPLIVRIIFDCLDCRGGLCYYAKHKWVNGILRCKEGAAPAKS